MKLRCLICGDTYTEQQVEYVCPKHGDEGILDVEYDYGQIQKEFDELGLNERKETSIWRYEPLLPIQKNTLKPLLAIGNTPLYHCERLAKHLGLQHLYIKDEGRNPTASLKDRAAAIAIVKAKERNANIITAASTGNAAAALSGLCAGIGQENVIFVPKTAPKAKITQLLVCGSRVMLVNGTYDDAFDLCLEATRKYGWYNRNTGYNPYMTEGKKTVSFEIFEQMNVPDVVLVSVGDGCIIGGVHKGFKDLLALGWIDKMPRIYGIQAEGSNYLTQAWERGEDVLTKAPIQAHTVADSISAGLPRDRMKAMRAVKVTNGAFIAVSDDAILEAIPLMATYTGVFGEPAGATALAGLLKLIEKKEVDSSEKIAIINTGNGLKDIPSANRALELVNRQATLIEANVNALNFAFDKRN
jgi:threonine synthase